MTGQKLKSSGFSGRILDVNSLGYQDALRRFSAVAERAAKFVVFPNSTADVSLAIRFATKAGLDIAVKGGGNHATPASSSEGGLVIDLEHLSSVVVDNNADQVTAGGGCRWGDVYSALHDHNRICIGGGVHLVGVGGHLTGGGWGPLTGKEGMGCDNVLAATVVLADGQIVAASESQRADLFWAVKGGSSQFGIVTEFTLRTFPRPTSWLSRKFLFSGDVRGPVVRWFQDFLTRKFDSDKWLMGFIIFARAPEPSNTPVVMVNFTGIGPSEHYADVFESLMSVAAPLSEETIVHSSVVGLSHALDGVLLGGPRRVMNSGAVVTNLWPGMAEDLWKSFVDYTASDPGVARSIVALEFHATKRKRPELSCFPVNEPVHHAIVTSAMHNDPVHDSAAEVWLRDCASIARGYQKELGGKDLGLAANATSIVVPPEDVWGASLECLRVVKAKYDPSHVFNKFHPVGGPMDEEQG